LLQDEIFAPWKGWVGVLGVLASLLFQSNATVGILAFSLGIAGGGSPQCS